MRLITTLSLAMPVLSLVSASMHDELHRREAHGQGLVARQRTSGGVLDPLLGGDEDETTSTTATTSQGTTAVGPTRAPTTTTPADEDPVTPTSSPPTTSSPVTSGVTRPSSSTSQTTEDEDVVSSSSISSTSVSTSASESNSTTLESSTSSESMSVEPSTSLSVDAGGETVVVTVMQSVVTQSVSRASAPASASASATEKKEDNDGLAIPMGAIIGISVGAGVVVLILIALAFWRMKRRSVDEDEAIRWPELNRHGDSDAHHALPAVQTGKHGIETDPLERSLSNSSSIYRHGSVAPAYDAGSTHMALNGSGFGAASTLDDDYYNEKTSGHGHGHDHYGANAGAGAGAAPYDLETDYTSYPPAIQPNHSNTGVNGAYDHDSDDENRRPGQVDHVTYPTYR